MRVIIQMRVGKMRWGRFLDLEVARQAEAEILALARKLHFGDESFPTSLDEMVAESPKKTEIDRHKK